MPAAPKITILIPFLNEEEGIDALVARLSSFFAQRPGLDAEVIFIDDGSTDKSVALLHKANHSGYQARILRLSRNYGSHAALRAGIQHARGEWIGFLYADLQDPPELAEQLINKGRADGLDVVWGTRSNLPTGTFERWFSRRYAGLMKKYVSPKFPANGFDIVFFTRKVQAVMNANVEANSSIFLQILTQGFRQGTVYYEKAPRKAGKSKWTLSKKIKLLVDSFVAFSFAPIRYVTLMGFLMSFAGMAYGLYLLIRKLAVNDLESGWPSLISILMLGFGLTNISLGIVAEYLWRTLDAARSRPVYIVDEVIDLCGNAHEDASSQ